MRAVAAALAAQAIAVAAHAQPAAMARAQDIVAGNCFVCHGAEGESSGAAFPRLAGQHAAYLARQLADFKSGRRKSSVMQPLVEELSADDFIALGLFFESRKPQAHALENPELAAQGRELFHRGKPVSKVPPCASCHGELGHGSPTLARLAGQHALYTTMQLEQFANRQRTNDNATMHDVARGLTAQEKKAVAAYISGLK